ncbi:insulinase family protein [Flavobacteriaceae bacterium Ap0902]|nr:insulinase family protein [Flavobacteriaceae bacterium Ap0902]
MKKTLLSIAAAGLAFMANAQQIDYEEYDLDNGLHVILHQDKSAPVVVTSVMYHVGAKDENPERTGFAHFFEHLLFEGTENIERGDWFKIVTSNGGKNNANTTDDRTYYYEVFPSNNLQLGLWMESERLLHPIINQIGVDTQNEVVKEEKRLRVDNSPYGNIIKAIKENIFTKHPYRWTTIGEMEHLDAATLEEFQDFNKKFYIPNNAVLVVAGDFDHAQAKEWIDAYFSEIPAGPAIERPVIKEDPITSPIQATWEDPNIQIPMYAVAYRTPAMTSKEAYTLDMLSTLLSGGKSSRLYKKMVDEDKTALQVGAFNMSQEDYGTYIIYGLPMGDNTREDMLNGYDREIERVQTELISEREYQKLQNKFENNYVSSNASVEGIAHSLATSYLLYGDTSLVNNEIDIYRSITRQDIQDVANKYLNPNQRVILDYVPAQEKSYP